MISPSYVRTMIAYNAEMNRRVYAAAACLSDAQRHADAGAFFGSMDATLRHLLWADQMWMSRFAAWAKPDLAGADSPHYGPPGFAALAEARAALDARLAGWGRTLDTDWLEGELAWWSGSEARELTQPRWFVLAHMFNHQTHHRGQIHALLTRAGQRTGATDLAFIVEIAA